MKVLDKWVCAVAVLAVGTAGCGAPEDGLARQTEQYQVIDEGVVSGVTSTIHAPGDTVPVQVPSPDMTGTNLDTTTAFTILDPRISTAPPASLDPLAPPIQPPSVRPVAPGSPARVVPPLPRPVSPVPPPADLPAGERGLPMPEMTPAPAPQPTPAETVPPEPTEEPQEEQEEEQEEEPEEEPAPEETEEPTPTPPPATDTDPNAVAAGRNQVR